MGGFCEKTTPALVETATLAGEGDCLIHPKGNFGGFSWTPEGGLRDPLAECMTLCASCANCNYVSVSFSPLTWDCSWHQRCNANRGGNDFFAE